MKIIEFLLYFRGLIKNDPALVQIIARYRAGEKPLSEPMMA